MSNFFYMGNQSQVPYNYAGYPIIQFNQPWPFFDQNQLNNFFIAQQSQVGLIEERPAVESLNREILNERRSEAVQQPEHQAVKPKRKRGIDKEKQLESAKKNSESNLINQFFSYFSSRAQSEEIVERAIYASVPDIESLQKVHPIFYNIIKCMGMKRVKKYVNKKTLLNIFERENIEKEIPDIIKKLENLDFITIDGICEIIRRCCFYFLRNIGLVSILSSKRISFISKREHLKKRRFLCSVVLGKI